MIYTLGLGLDVFIIISDARLKLGTFSRVFRSMSGNDFVPSTGTKRELRTEVTSVLGIVRNSKNFENWATFSFGYKTSLII